MIPAAAAVPTSAGTFALRVAVPTVSPTFSAADPTVPPTPLSALVTPFCDCGFAELRDLRGRELRDLLASDEDEPIELFARPCEGDRLVVLRLVDAPVLRLGALPFRLVDPDRRAARRVLVWAIRAHLPQGCYGPLPWGTRRVPGCRLFESDGRSVADGLPVVHVPVDPSDAGAARSPQRLIAPPRTVRGRCRQKPAPAKVWTRAEDWG